MYEISNLGRVKSLARKVHMRMMPERIMVLHSHHNGYKVVWLRKEKTHIKFYIQRLVAEAFIPNPEGKDVVNHIDCNKFNNCISNLEWMTFSENTQYYYKNKNKMVSVSVSVHSEEIDPEEIPF